MLEALEPSAMVIIECLCVLLYDLSHNVLRSQIKVWLLLLQVSCRIEP